jgi:anthranilate phosphoribosyltransferase
VSSRSGSADVLEALGVPVDIAPELVVRCVLEVGIGFFFAPRFHGAMRHAAPVRQKLGVRTFFNLLGPLANPARATHQLLGVYEARRVRQLAEVLGLLGVTRAWVVHGEGGLDEISPFGPTYVARLEEGRVTEDVLEPADFGVEPTEREGLRGGDASDNADIARRVLGGEVGDPRTAVLINAGAALCVAGVASTAREGAERAASAIDSGAARELLDRWSELSRTS